MLFSEQLNNKLATLTVSDEVHVDKMEEDLGKEKGMELRGLLPHKI